jgi:hypothetical protein
VADDFTSAQKAYIDQRIRAVTMNEDIAAFGLWRTLGREVAPKLLPKSVAPKGAYKRRKPAEHMKGTPPKGHPAR